MDKSIIPYSTKKSRLKQMEDTTHSILPSRSSIKRNQFPIVATFPSPHDFYQTLLSLDILAYSS